MKLLIMQLPPVSISFHPLRPKYLPQYFILKHPHPQLMFSPQCEKPNFKHTQNNMQNHGSMQSLHTEENV
jgi:hypothetical protein